MACTNDITAYKSTDLYHQYLDGKIPEGYHFVLDEVYASIGGPLHLTPFTRAQLRNARKEGNEKYEKMKAFNFFLSSQLHRTRLRDDGNTVEASRISAGN